MAGWKRLRVEGSRECKLRVVGRSVEVGRGENGRACPLKVEGLLIQGWMGCELRMEGWQGKGDA